MLDAETKRRIDSCRDMLVGKVPDPKSQVEQITVALIYKFMDDMDAEAEELGGRRSFFAGEFAKYGWARLLSPSLGGFEMLGLYSEAIATMGTNPGLPPLFRDIFKNAYLPYRDPETLRAFLKEINGFTYDHSERLGDAFEYLLSVLGSQGDAGQFRTPRHIIDFIVNVVDPQKGDKILDPACGTAGFLVSSYKHILAANKNTPLTGEERGRLAKNIVGYDISPDMVRLSLVNLYLHGFPQPQIEEYDTLTSDDKWGEYFDVILANPPFMSPKGGIKPHKRFSVQSSRSEVLFVDYIAEHLSPQGRAGIIVPEGIIFQSGGAYKSLRKMLVSQSLVAVVSLPAGVFNPYAGVKTSVLILDKGLAAKSDSVLFVKIASDGFGLGAQRRAVAANDLPEAGRLLLAWRESLRDGTVFDAGGAGNVTVVGKGAIAGSGEYNLSAERYAPKDSRLQTVWPNVPLKDLLAASGKERIGDNADAPIMSITMKSGLVDQADKFKRRIASADISGYKKVLRNELVVGFPIDEGVLGFQTKYDYAAVSPAYDIWKLRDENNSLAFLELLFRCNQARALYLSKMRGTANRRRTIDKADFLEIAFPLPPLAVQQEIVAEIGGYQKVIDGARQVVENYKPRIVIDPAWQMVALGDVCEINPKKSVLSTVSQATEVSFVPMADLSDKDILFTAKDSRALAEVVKQYTYFANDDVLLAKVTPCFENGKSGIARDLVNGIGFGSSEFVVLRACQNKILPEWIYFNVTADHFRTSGKLRMTGTGGLQRVPINFISTRPIPLPDIETQQAIVTEIDEEQRLVAAARQLIARFEAKITAAIARVWGED